MPCAHPLNCSERVVQFANAIIKLPFAIFGASKIEAQSLISRPHECARQRVRDLVVHSAAMLRMRVANNSAPLQCTIARTLNNGFQAADRPVYKQFFCYRMCGHGVPEVDSSVNTAVKLWSYVIYVGGVNAGVLLEAQYREEIDNA